MFFYKVEHDKQYNQIGFKKISEFDFVKDVSSSLHICNKDFSYYIEIPCNQVESDDSKEKTKKLDQFYESIIDYSKYVENRNDKDLIDVIEILGATCASHRFAKLKIVEIPDNIEYEIDSYDGVERVHEKHKIWR